MRQAIASRELERWKGRAASLEARLRGATEARRQWAMKEAELAEENAAQARLLHAQERLHTNTQYLRNAIIAAAERGPDGLVAALPVIGSFLEFSPEELRRIELGQTAATPSTSNLWGLLETPAPPRAASSALGADTGTAFARTEPAAKALGGEDGADGSSDVPETADTADTAGGGPPAAATRAAAPPNGAAPNGAGATGEEKVPTSRVTRMKRLLVEAERQLALAKSTIAEREAEISRLNAAAASRRII